MDYSDLPSTSSLSSAVSRPPPPGLPGLERQAALRTLAVPVDDGEVRRRLRAAGQPITFFGERAYERRERLKEIVYAAQGLSRPTHSDGSSSSGSERDPTEEPQEEEEEFYTPGTESLLSARQAIAQTSLRRAQARLAAQRLLSTHPPTLASLIDARKSVLGPLGAYTTLGSQVAHDRPVSQVRFSPDSSLIATGAWSGQISLWSVPALDPHPTTPSLHGHTGPIGGLAWHPQATLTQPPEALNLLSGAADGAIHLWSLASDTPLASIPDAHPNARITKCAFHPMGSMAASAAWDGTWALWDVSTKQSLLKQYGHARELHALAIQTDGSLLASAGLDSIGRIWDLRTGKTTTILEGHAAPVLSLDFAPNGYQIASGSMDDTCRIWDLRAQKCLYTIAAHTNNVSEVKFYNAAQERPALDPEAESETEMQTETGTETVKIPRSGMYLATASYDQTLKLWSADDWQLVRTVQSGTGRLMSVDVADNGTYLATGSFSRSLTLYGAL